MKWLSGFIFGAVATFTLCWVMYNNEIPQAPPRELWLTFGIGIIISATLWVIS